MQAEDLPPLPCYLNGAYTELPNARVSVMDRGFIFGDGVYEVIPVYAGRPFLFAQHMDRLERSLAAVRMTPPLDRAGWLAIAQQLIERLAVQRAEGDVSRLDQLVYLQVTRGVALRDHVIPTDASPTVFAMTNVMRPPSSLDRALGVACVSAEDFRWKLAHIKSTSLLGSVLARQISADVGAAETIMFREGFLSEGSASNVWVVRGRTVMGPPLDHLVLEGVRYRLIESFCRQLGLGFELRRIDRAEVEAADELLLSSATKEVLPVTTLDDRPVGSGKPGPVYAALYAAYQQAKQESSQ
ncbi:D-alanine transaminase [Tibeticola sediminis]|uniref:D-alanine transaminase n=1 Tax=Tibeticola sediminis TaxID=1917811 RepID=A0A3N4V5G7_9BURK|nr:aminotransferase class IV [Tibeticola sediminis]RPE72357.1 D-alanine transaminase [Tibeticola sediminis]